MNDVLPQVGLAIKRLQIRHHRAFNEALAPLGLTVVQWDALRHLHENPDASLHDLAQLTFQTDQAFGTLANRMIDRGLIARLAGPGRAIKHELTAEGDAIRIRASAIVETVLAGSFSSLDATELDALHDLLRRLLSQ